MINLHPDFSSNLFLFLFTQKYKRNCFYIAFYFYFHFLFICFIRTRVSEEHLCIAKHEACNNKSENKFSSCFSFGITNIGCRYYYLFFVADFLEKIDLRKMSLMWHIWWLEGFVEKLILKKSWLESVKSWF